MALICAYTGRDVLALPNAPPETKAQGGQNLTYQLYVPFVMDGAESGQGGFAADDGSSLIVGACQDCDCCLPMIIQAKVTNAGNGDMAGTSSYEVWYSPNGNPKDGVKVAEGIIPALKGDPVHEYVWLIYNTGGVTGNFMFKVYQRPGHEGTGVA